MKNYIIISQISKAKVKDLEVEFTEKVAICKETEKEIYLRELEIENDITLYDLYKKEKGLLQSFEIRNIRAKYNLNQKDFSKIIGLGEITIHRYENGTIQTDANDSIIRLSDNPENMETLADKNKKKVNHAIYKELLERIEQLKLYYKHKIAQFNKKEICNMDFETLHVETIAEKTIELYNNKVKSLVNEFHTDVPKITNLELQKLLYYIQGLSLFVFDKAAFNEELYAWEYGPIVYEIYSKYKKYKSHEIDVTCNKIISNGLEKIIEIVVDSYGKYTGRQLINLTHDEEPWLNTPKNNKINIALIEDYFKKVYSL